MRILIFLTLVFNSISIIAADLNITITQPSHGQCNGKIDLTILGGFPLYDIVWTNPQGVIKQANGINGNDGQEDVNNLCPNVQYCVSITDAACGILNYCWTLTECPEITVSAFIDYTPPSSCSSMDGWLRVVTRSHQGGQEPFTYHIEDQYGNKYYTDFNGSVRNLRSGKYYYVVTDANGCTGSYEFDLIAENGFSVHLASLQNSCAGYNLGRIEIFSFSNDQSETYNYHWSNGVDHFNLPEFESSIIDNLAAGTYCVTVTSNTTSCEYIDCYTIIGNSGSPLILTSNLTMPCKNTRNGKINLNVSGGTIPYTFLWDPPGTLPQFGLYAGNYCVTVTDFCGASINQCFELKEVSFELQSGILCKNQGWGEIQIMNGTPPYTITWFVNGLGAIGHGTRIDNLHNGNYIVFGHDSKGCNFNYDFEIKYITKNYIEFLKNNSSCTGDMDSQDGEIRIGSIDSRNYSFSWTGPFGFTSTNRNINMLRPGNYKVTITDPDGCIEFIEQIICCCSANNTDLPACPNYPLITATSDEQAVTIDNSCNGFIHLSVAGGNGTYFYNWAGPNGYSSKLRDIDNLCKGDYCVTITDGCQYLYKCINIPNCSDKDIKGNAIVVHTCPTFNAGSITLSTTGGKPEIKWNWVGPFGFSSTASIIKDLAEGTYTVTITDAQKCKKIETYTINSSVPFRIERGCPGHGKCDECHICYNQSYVIRSHEIKDKVNPNNCSYRQVCEDDESIVVGGPYSDDIVYEWDENINSCILYKTCKNHPNTKTPLYGTTTSMHYQGKILNKNGSGLHCYYCFDALVCSVINPEGILYKRYLGNVISSVTIAADESCPDGVQCKFKVYCGNSTTPFETFCTSLDYYCKSYPLGTTPPYVCDISDIDPIRKDTIVNGRLIIKYEQTLLNEELSDIINELEKVNSIDIAKTNFYNYNKSNNIIDFLNLNKISTLNYKITDLYGRVLLNSLLSNESILAHYRNLNNLNWPSGIYLIEISDKLNSVIYVQKIFLFN